MMSGHVADLLSRCGVDRQAYEALPPFLRSLMVTDGTVTTVLEAWFCEPVAVHVKEQSTSALVHQVPVLDADVGETVMQRRVTLMSDRSSRLLATASSLLRVQALPGDLRDELLAGKLGIGELLRRKGVETCREIIGITLPTMGTDPAYAERTYLIHMNVMPVICVTERFPLEVYL